jgi:hypothetical protein
VSIRIQGGVTVVRHVDGHRVLAQPLGDGIGEQPLIFGHQNPHTIIMHGQGVRAALGAVF